MHNRVIEVSLSSKAKPRAFFPIGETKGVRSTESVTEIEGQTARNSRITSSTGVSSQITQSSDLESFSVRPIDSHSALKGLKSLATILQWSGK